MMPGVKSMNGVDRIENLERRVKELENQIKKLVNEQEIQTSTYQRLVSNEIEVQQIKIVEKDGTVRMSIHNKERPLHRVLPDRLPHHATTILQRRGGVRGDGELGGLTIQNTVGLNIRPTSLIRCGGIGRR